MASSGRPLDRGLAKTGNKASAVQQYRMFANGIRAARSHSQPGAATELLLTVYTSSLPAIFLRIMTKMRPQIRPCIRIISWRLMV